MHRTLRRLPQWTRRCRINAGSRLQRGGAVHSQKHPLSKRLVEIPPCIKSRDNLRDAFSWNAINGLSPSGRLPIVANLFGHRGQRSHHRIGIREELVLQPQWMQLLHPLARGELTSARTMGCTNVR